MWNQREWMEAIQEGDENRLVRLLRSGAAHDLSLDDRITLRSPTNHCIGFGMTLLQFASFRNRRGTDLASVLVERGADVDLHSACGMGCMDRVEEIITSDAGAIHRQVDTYTPIQFAISGSNPEIVQRLFEFGENPNRDIRKVAYFGWEDAVLQQDYQPWRLIHMAALWAFGPNRVPVVAALAQAGADLSAVSPLDGYHPIHLVAMSNRIDVIRFLCKSGVNVDSRAEPCRPVQLAASESGPMIGEQCTPLMVAAAEGCVEATECLLELGANPQATNHRGESAMDLAARCFWDGRPYDKVMASLADKS